MSNIPNTDCERLVKLLTQVNVSADGIDQISLNPIQDQLSTTLDALANILMSGQTKEVLAVGLQRGCTDGNLCYTLTLTSNNSITQETLAYCQRIVEYFKKLGLQFYKLQRNNIENKANLTTIEGPKLNEKKFPKNLKSLVDSFKADVHRFSLPKLRQHLNKASNGTTSYLEFHSYITDLPDSANNIVRSLKNINLILSWADRHLCHFEEIPEDCLRIFIEGMERIDAIVHKIFRIKDWMVQLSPASTFPVERFLRKISSIPSAIDTLLKGAYSPRIYHHFLARQKIKVKILPNPPRQITLPASDQWAEASKQVFTDSHLDLSLQNHIQEALCSQIHDEQIYHGSVHCECLLALHLLGENRGGVHSAQYLGVSKLPCLACWAFLKALRINGFIFYTKGYHRKAYFPWKFPDSAVDETGLPHEVQTRITASFLTGVSRIYMQCLHEQKMNKLSDSSTGSSSETDYDWNTTMDSFRA